VQYTYVTPPASRAADRPTPVDDALVAAARCALVSAIETVPFPGSVSRRAYQALFARAIESLCVDSRRKAVPIEKLIVAIKLAWASVPEIRLRLGETAPDTLTSMVTACIEAYFADEQRPRGD
jgi:hypothetical protein